MGWAHFTSKKGALPLPWAERLGSPLNTSQSATRAPASAGLPGGANTIVVGVWMMQPGEDLIVAKRLREVLQTATAA